MLNEIWLPDSIRAAVRNKPCAEDNVGMSGSRIFIFDDTVLKIQKHSEETDNELRVIEWLDGRLPVPEIIEYAVKDGTAYCLMTRIKGRMICDKVYMREPEILVEIAAKALEMLWAADICGCPCDASLDVKLEAAKYNVENNLVDMDNAEPETFGRGGFASPEELLLWLYENRPVEEPVLSHGDFCLPNIFADKNNVTGFIDLGRAGTADKWQDIAICYRSLKHNFEGKYSGGRVYGGFYPEMLFERLQIRPEPDKLRYYILLDELF